MVSRTKFLHLCTGLLPILLGVLAVGGLLLGAQPASAATSGVDGCIQDVWKNHGNTQSLTCTANDVRIAEVTNITVTAGGSGSCTSTTGDCKCTSADPAPTDCATHPEHAGCVTFTADFKVVLTAQTRYDIGLYIATDGGGTDGALTGQCFDSVITSTNAPVTFFNPDPTDTGLKPLQPNDVCGDIENTTAHNPQIVHQTVSVACVADPATGKLNLPNCTSWRQPGSNTECTQFSDAYPGSPSKCNCQPQFPINIKVSTPTITTTKTARTTVVPEGSSAGVIYDVTVKNNGSITVHLESLTDDIYGDISTVHGDVTATTCTPLPHDIAAGATYSCNFTATVSGVGVTPGTEITDTVCAAGHDAQGDPVGGTTQTDPPSSFCDDATVTITDVASDASVKKTVDSATVTYHVVVHNSSTVDTLLLHSLCDDKFGDISGNQNSANPSCGAACAACTFVSTTCPNVPLSMSAGGSDVNCTFVGTITPAATGTTTETDTVTGVLTDDTNTDITRTDSATVTITQ